MCLSSGMTEPGAPEVGTKLPRQMQSPCLREGLPEGLRPGSLPLLLP